MTSRDTRRAGRPPGRDRDGLRAKPADAPEVPRPEPRPAAAPRAAKASPMQTLRGIAVSPGVAIGPALVLDPRGLRLPARAIAAEAVAGEIARLDRGLEGARIEAEAA